MKPFTNTLLRLALLSIITASAATLVVAAAAETSFDCIIHQITSMPAKGEPIVPHQTVCRTEEEIENYLILDGDIDAFFLKSPFSQFEVGRTQLSIPTSLIGEDKRIDLDDHLASELIVITNRRLTEGLTRQAIHRVGTWNVLAVRVVDSTGDAPTRSKSQLASDIFDDAFNLVSVLMILILSTNTE